MATTTLNARPTRQRRLRLALFAGLFVLIALGSYPVGRHVWATGQRWAALQALDKREFPAARSHLDACLTQWPDSAETHFLAARAARRAGDLDAAQVHLKNATRLGWVTEALQLERALAAAQSGQYQNAAPALMALVRRGHPDSILIVEILAPLYLKTFQLLPALECLGFWIDLEPAYHKPYSLRGDVHNRMMHRDQALEDFERAVALAPDDADARMSLGNLLVQQKFPDRAKTHFDWLWERRRDDPAVQRGMANCLSNLGHHGEARDVLEELLAANPDDPMTLGILGQLELNADQPERAEIHLKRAASMMPHELSLLYLLGVCLERNDKAQEAAAVREREKRTIELQEQSRALMNIITKQPRNVEARRRLAECLMKVGMEDEAKRWLENALEMNPQHGPTYATLARLSLLMGQQKQYEAYKKMAAELPQPKWWRPEW